MIVSYKERIARRLTLVTALIVLLVFAIIYMVVDFTLINSIDRDLKLETDKHKGQIFIINGEIKFVHKNEWQEEEHTQIQLNPIFIEIVDLEGNSMDKSPNLQENHLSFYPDASSYQKGTTVKVGANEVRQMQIPLFHNGVKEGYLLVAKSFDDIRELLNNLRNILLILYPGILISLFLSMRYLAGKSIEPIQKIIRKTNQISQRNLNERVPVIEPNDEIAQLSRSINNLLSRLEQALNREKQFTSDASHELRTPLSVLRGTLEVLIRKPRTSEEYVEKIKTSLESIDGMSAIIDQLLALARAGLGEKIIEEEIELLAFCKEITEELAEETGGNIVLDTDLTQELFVHVNEKSLQMILSNLLQNAVKYSPEKSRVTVNVGSQNSIAFIQVIDRGYGIGPAFMEKIFNPFYRSEEVMDKNVSGSGLGLAIVKKLAEESGLQVDVSSELGVGSTFTLYFERKI